jgi:hypothetical protein
MSRIDITLPKIESIGQLQSSIIIIYFDIKPQPLDGSRVEVTLHGHWQGCC